MKLEGKYVIMGNPVPWARPGRTKFSTAAYDTQKQQKIEYGWHLKASHGAQRFFSGPLAMHLVFHLPISKTAAKRDAELDGKIHDKKPDLDNLEKFVLDASTGILWEDDCIVARVTKEKRWSLNPRTEMFIREI